jgi:hypothetical protein
MITLLFFIKVPITLTEKTANIHHILQVLKQHFNKDMVLVDVKALKINDSDHTRGFNFWKSTRKIYCIEHNEFNQLQTNKRRKESDESSDDNIEGIPIN